MLPTLDWFRDGVRSMKDTVTAFLPTSFVLFSEATLKLQYDITFGDLARRRIEEEGEKSDAKDLVADGNDEDEETVALARAKHDELHHLLRSKVTFEPSIGRSSLRSRTTSTPSIPHISELPPLPTPAVSTPPTPKKNENSKKSKDSKVNDGSKTKHKMIDSSVKEKSREEVKAEIKRSLSRQRQLRRIRAKQRRAEHLEVERTEMVIDGNKVFENVTLTGHAGLRDDQKPGVANQEFQQVSFDSSLPSTVGITLDGDTLFARAGMPPTGFIESLHRFVKSLRQHPRYHAAVKAFQSPLARDHGGHQRIILGTSRSYSPNLHLTQVHRKEPSFVNDVLNHPEFNRIVGYANSLLFTHFPNVFKRYRDANQSAASGFASLFGVFPQMCVNFGTGKTGVLCRAHTDFLNPAGGICVVIPYGDFDSKSQYWLYLEELDVVLEAPAGVPILFPSSLIRHGNVHVAEAPSPEVVREGGGIPRGSIVFYAQSTWVISGEVGMGLEAFNQIHGYYPHYEGLENIFRRC